MTDVNFNIKSIEITFLTLRIMIFNIEDIISADLISMTLKSIVLNIKDIISINLMLKLTSVTLFLQI